MALYRESYIFCIATDPPALFWSGHGDLALPADTVLPDGAVALGAGNLVNIPDLEQLINGVAQRIEVTLSGVSEETVALAQEDAQEVPGAAVQIGRVRFDQDWQISGAVEWEWEGEATSLGVSGESSDAGRSRTITLRVAAGDTTRSRSPLAYFTDADQRRDFPTDTVFSHVAGITLGTSRRFGPS